MNIFFLFLVVQCLKIKSCDTLILRFSYYSESFIIILLHFLREMKRPNISIFQEIGKVVNYFLIKDLLFLVNCQKNLVGSGIIVM